MTEQKETLEKLLSAAKLHVPFDGWGDVTFNASCEDAGLDPKLLVFIVHVVDWTLLFITTGYVIKSYLRKTGRDSGMMQGCEIK